MAHDDESTEPRSEETRPSEGTLALIYDEVGQALREQHIYAESLNGRAQQLFGFASIVFAIIAAVVPTHPSVGIRILYAIALPVFLAAAGYSAKAWEFRRFHFDPDPENLWEDYRLKSEEHVRHRVIHNRREALQKNDSELDDKLKWIKRARVCLYVGFGYLAVLLIYQVAVG